MGEDGRVHAVSEQTDENGKLFINCTFSGFKYEMEDEKWKMEIDNHMKEVHKDAFDEDILALHGGYIFWK